MNVTGAYGRGDMTALLSKAGKDLTVSMLLDALQQTKDFELSMSRKFATPVRFLWRVGSSERSDILVLFASQFHEILQATSTTPTRPLQSISSAFDPHMGVYVDAQDKYVGSRLLSYGDLRHTFRSIADMLAAHRASRSRVSLDTAQSTTASEDGDAPTASVLPSSTELFYFYGQTLEGCAKLSTGKPLFDLCEVFRKWLRVYAGASSAKDVW